MTIEPTADEIERVETAIRRTFRELNPSWTSIARAAILAMDRRSSPPAPAVAVKPLDWARGWMNAEAASILGPYKITYRRDGSFEWIIGEHNVWAPSWDAAMAAAQADYEQRIRSALVEPAPAVAVGELDDKWKRACAAQSRKLQYVLCIPGVKEALDELEWETWSRRHSHGARP